ncbi:MAG: hypothetical protein JOZ09_18865 [Pseudonocardiales bacterium]|jgi:hypothetical protein|nr:hypothetical protein [Pseudonocardiales bacterium]
MNVAARQRRRKLSGDAVVREAGDQRPGVGCHTRGMQAGFLRCVEPRYGLLYQLTAAGITVPSAGTNECFVASFGLA